MIFEVKNIGKIRHADVKLDGITVIAGENNTGKSTIGKMLFCVFNSFYMKENQIRLQRLKSIRRLLINFVHEVNGVELHINIKYANEIVDKADEYIEDRQLLINDLKKWYPDSDVDENVYIEVLNQLADKIISYMKIPDEKVIETMFNQRINAEFSMKIGHLNYEEDSYINLSIKNNTMNIKVSHSGNIQIDNCMSLIKNIIYIDNPFVLDEINGGIHYRMPVDHKYDLINKLSDNNKDNDFDALDKILVDEKLKNIYNAINDVCDGELSLNDQATFEYKTSKLKEPLDIVNISTGMKSFIIIKTLLQNGSIDENGIIILDEPEIHLHPEWQLKFAEIIVLLQKEFGLNILLNTHSPYFLNAIEVYSKKYNITEHCNYYMTNEINSETYVKDVTDDIEQIYAKLARPLQDLENMEYEYGDKN